MRKWIVSGGIIVALYALIQLLVAGAHINRVPAYTSFFLIGLLGLAGLTGLVFKDRAFCRGFCPVGLLLGTYGRGGMLAVRAGAASTCQGCTGKDCIMACNRTRPNSRSCSSLLNPPKLNTNKDCLVCGQCIKACQPDNMRLMLRPPFAASDTREAAASWPVTVFVVLVSGFVIWELFTEWPAAEQVFLAAPVWAAATLGWPIVAGWFEGVWALSVVPVVLWSMLAATLRLFGEKQRLGDLWRRMALPMVVVISAGHMSKGLAKLVSWAPFLPDALREPAGLNAAARTVPPPAPFLELSTVGLVCIVLVSVALAYGIREYRMAHQGERVSFRSIYPVAAFAAAFALVLAGWIVH